MKNYMVQVDLADQSQIGKSNGTVTVVFASGPFKRVYCFTLDGARRFAQREAKRRPNCTIQLYRREWVEVRS
jgi:hypothetical protein